MATGEEWKDVPTKGMAAYAAPSLFQPHKARQAIRDAHEKKIPPILCYYAGLSSLPITRFLAPMNYDAVWIDWEHTSCNVETMTNMVHEAIFMSQGRTIPWVRVPGTDHAAIGWALDAGASIVIPQVETVEQAKHALSSAKFGTKFRGTRSVPPFRLIPQLTDMAADPSRGDVWRNVNDQAAVMFQIESKAGVDNLDDILTQCPDVDVIWLGSLDARVSMNLPGMFGGIGATEPEWLEVKDKFFATLKKHDKPYAGFAFHEAPFGSAEGMREAAKGMSLITMAADVFSLMGMAQTLHQVKELVALPQNGKAEHAPNGSQVANGH